MSMSFSGRSQNGFARSKFSLGIYVLMSMSLLTPLHLAIILS
jgi:hypothetical protein